MNINNWFDMMIPLSKNRIDAAIEEVMKDCARRNFSDSTVEFESSVVNGIKAIKVEVENYIEMLSILKLSKSKWEKVRTKLNQFIKDSYENIYKFLKKKNKKLGESRETAFKLECEKKIKEICGVLELKVNIQIQLVNDKFWGNILGVLKIVFSALVGALIGSHIN